MIAAPIFRNTDGVLSSSGSKTSLEGLGWNCLGAVTLLAYYFVVSTVLFIALDKVGLCRVDPKHGESVLDIVKHNERAYDYGELLSRWVGHVKSGKQH